MILRMTVVLWYGLLCLFIIFPFIDAGEENYALGNTTSNWIAGGSFNLGYGSVWDKQTLTTTVTELGAEAWMITDKFKYENISNQIYIYMVAKLRSCRRATAGCDLQIYAFYNEHVNVPAKKDGTKRRDYLNKNFVNIHNSTHPAVNTKTNETFPISVSGPHIRLAIKAKEASWKIYELKMFYYFCEDVTTNNIYLSKTNASMNVTANCSENSLPKDELHGSTVQCLENGTWGEVSNKCFCNKGFQPSNSGGCQQCPQHHNKSLLSNGNCTECRNDKTNNTDFTACVCPKAKPISTVEKCYGLPEKVNNLKGKITGNTVKLTWSNPPGDFDGLLMFDMSCHICDGSCDKPCTTEKYKPGQYNITTTYVTISNLIPGSQYKFTIFSILKLTEPVLEEWKSAKIEVSVEGDSSKSSDGDKGPSQLYLIIGCAGAALLLILLLLIIVCSRSRRNNKSDEGLGNPGFIELPSVGQKLYVDPTNYDDPEAALRDFANEIDPKSLRLERVLGGGEFGDVYKGNLTKDDGTTILIAAKTLKHDSDERSRKDFFLEASAMGQFKDPNVINLEGIITKTVPHMILTEYMSNGSLDHFLKQNDGQLTDLQMVGMARGVASGMTYLAEMHFVHRDLAARNILVNDTLVCKVADFGLSRELETTDSSMGEYCTSGGKIPVRWTAPEAIKYRKFSTASDVWSYGILLWEIMTFGERPYWDWDNFKVMERVDEGFRLPAPQHCPKRIHELMLRCWEKERNERPQFSNIVTLLDAFIRSPEAIRDESSLKRNSLPPGKDMDEQVKLIRDWLNDIRMSSYVPHFTQAGYEHLQELAGLSDDDLKKMGVTLVGHRNKMMHTIRTLPAATSVQEQNKEAWKRAKSLRV